ncbi:MAG: membrane protein FxsA [Desulfuromonas sp.]|nr:MAG: membrane protein FxsA [Desulfuromonas sp.]
MFVKLLVIFTLVPVFELFLLIEVGRVLGTAQTVLLIIATGIAGAWLARTQGIDTLKKIQAQTAQGQMPAGSMIDGMIIFVGGLLLLTPGFCTDLLGFSCLVPLTRSLWRQAIVVWLEKQLRQGTLTIRRF